MTEQLGENEVKVVVVGDAGVGKTCMIYCHQKDEFPKEYPPPIVDPRCRKDYNGRDVELQIFDTLGQEEFVRLRSIIYPKTNCFLVCFSLLCKQSLKNAYTQWRNELITLGPPNCP